MIDSTAAPRGESPEGSWKPAGVNPEQVYEVHKGEHRDETAGKKDWSGGQKARIEIFPRPSFEPGHAPGEGDAGKENR
jgi:hypothetical protein